MVKKRLLIIFILTFAAIADLVPPLIVAIDGFLGIIKIFLILGTLFILQDTFKWIRVIAVVLICLLSIPLVITLLFNWNFYYFFTTHIFIAAAVPLYVSLIIMGAFTFLFLRNYDIFK